MTDLIDGVDRIAFIGDLHRDYPYTLKAIKYAQKQGAQVIIQLGDFAYDYPDTYLDMIQDWMERFGMIFTFVDGNHENFDVLYSYPLHEDGTRRLRERVWHLPRGFRWSYQGVNFLALGGAHSVDKSVRTPGAEWWPQEHINYAEYIAAIKGGSVDVMVTHDCPSGVDLRLGDSSWIPQDDLKSANIHRDIIAMVVDEVEPKFLFHGHYHIAHSAVRDGPWVSPYSSGLKGTYIIGLGCNKQPLDQVIKVVDIADLR